MQVDVNIQVLERAAQNSEQKEAYQLLTKTGAFRIGAGARIDPHGSAHFFVEVTIRLTSEDKVSIERMEQAVDCLKLLETRGYSLTHQNGTITCEAAMLKERLTEEYAAVKTILEKRFRFV